MSKVQIKMNAAAERELLRSPAVQKLLLEKAEAIAAATGPTMVPGVDMIAGVDVGRNRARGYVYTRTNRAKYGEAKDRRLTQAIGAGRG